ncbi:MAG: ribosome maturation factor RimM [Candidatus Pacebacteria bacterium]|nr:ribosome maturation factor RimM [Candidatus Paceibacterota bacterium]
MSLLVGEITAPHGIRGAFKVQSYTADPLALLDYPELKDARGRVFKFKLVQSLNGGVLLVTLAGVTDRNGAEALRGTKLLIAREALPPTEDEDEFYYTDLIGCNAVAVDGASLGKVLAVHDFGAGVFLEVGETRPTSTMIPFSHESVPEIDLEQKTVTIIPPILKASDDQE